MLHGEALGLLVGAVALGAVHGIEPGHGWPVAASYALDQANKWVYGFAASFILGLGHLVSSIAMVAVFFYAKSYFELTRINEPIHLAGNVVVGGPVSLVAGVLLILLGIREYRHGHSHGHGHDHSNDAGHDHSHDHGHHDHSHDHGHHDDAHDHGRSPDHDDGGRWARLKGSSRSSVATLTLTVTSTTPPTGGCGASRGSRSCWGSPTRRSSRPSRCVPGRTTVWN